MTSRVSILLRVVSLAQPCRRAAGEVLFMTMRLLIAYLLIALLTSGAAGAIWWMIYNSPRQKLRRYYRAKHEHSKR
jgi:hypothetical protein